MTTRRSEGEPHDRLTALGNELVEALEGEDVKAIVMLQDDERGGITIYGYDDEGEAIADLIIHLQAIFESVGKQLMVVPVGSG